MNERVARQHFAISMLQPTGYSLCQPWLKGYNNQGHSSGWVSAAKQVSFYGARYWIDRDLKKSMGR